MCWAHERSELGIDPGTGKKLVVVAPAAKLKTAAVVADEVFAHIEKAAKVQVKEVVEPVPLVPNAEMYMYLENLFMQKRLKWLHDAANTDSLVANAKVLVRMIDALEGLGY
jgi:hypothetical protein